MNKVLVSVLGFIFVGCSGINSELNTPYVEDGEAIKKPQCQFKLSDNCWTRSMSLLMSCVPSSPQVGKFSNNLRKCEFESGKDIIFNNRKNLSGNFDKDPLDFEVYNNEETCFRFVGVRDSFHITSPNHGHMKVKLLENGDTQISCLFGESFTMTAEMKEKGCQDQNEKSLDFLPRASLEDLNKEKSAHFRFAFRGQGAQSQLVFNCKK